MPSSSFKLDKQILLRAGAGAGKTTALTHLFFRYVREFRELNKNWPRVVITTFTRKATQEIKERLLKMALENGSMELFQYASSRSQVHISTIHGILSIFLNRYGSEIGMSPDLQIISEVDLRESYRGLLRDIFSSHPELGVLLESMDYNQLEEALNCYFENWVAFPEATYADQILQRQVIFSEIVGFRSRLIRVCKEILLQTNQDKYVAYYRGILDLPWEMSPDSIDTFLDSAQDFFQSHRKPVLSKDAYDLGLEEEFKSIKDELTDFLKDRDLMSSEFLREVDERCLLFEKLAHIYVDRILNQKIQSGLISMADLELLSLYLLRRHPEVGQSFSKEWNYWMIDEYQDTSPLQVELLQHLVGQQNSFVVGDPQQSIYLFRGARAEVFHHKHDHVTKSDGHYEFRTDNWRSTPHLLGFLNFCFEKIDSSQFEAMTTKRDLLEGQPIVAEWIRYDKDEVPKEKSSKVEELAVVCALQELISQNPTLPMEEICVLARTNQALKNLAEELDLVKMPYNLHSGGSFFERSEIRDSILFTKFILNPHDNFNLIGLLRSPWFFMEDDEIQRFVVSESTSYWSVFCQSQHPRASELKKYLESGQQIGLSEVLKIFLISRGVFDTSQELESGGRREANLWKFIQQLASEERRPGFNFLNYLSKGRGERSPDEESGESDAATVIEPRKVQLMTVHASKGLQFEHVIIMDMNGSAGRVRNSLFTADEISGRWSLQIRDESTQTMKSTYFAKLQAKELKKRERDESRRLLYVAMTRAKSHITLVTGMDANRESWADILPLESEPGVYTMTHRNLPFAYRTSKAFFSPALWLESTANTQGLDSIKSKWQVSHYPTLESCKNTSSLEGALSFLQRTQFGIEIHSVMELMKYHSVDKIGESMDLESLDIYKQIQATPEIPFHEILSHGFAEWGFNIYVDGQPKQGRIDLWGIVPESKEVWIIDYKTGSSEHREKGAAQLRFYQEALTQLGKIPDGFQVKLALIYPDRVLFV